MHLFRETLLLFGLNLLDAFLTLAWVRSGVAGEANYLMARLLDIGDFAFVGAKFAIGLFAAIVFLLWGDRRIARYGISLALLVYAGVMVIHAFTGYFALRQFLEVSSSAINDLSSALSALVI